MQVYSSAYAQKNLIENTMSKVRTTGGGEASCCVLRAAFSASVRCQGPACRALGCAALAAAFSASGRYPGPLSSLLQMLFDRTVGSGSTVLNSLVDTVCK